MKSNIKPIVNNTEETLRDARKLLSNLDNILVHKYLESPVLNIKKALLEDDMIPITSNTMFKTMLYNGNRIKYSKHTLSYILPENYINFTLLKSETDKETYEDKDMIVDFVAISKDLIINIEMNRTNKLERNANYLYRLCSREIKKGSEYKYLKGIQININEFNPPHNKIMSLHYTRDRVGDVYIPQIFVNIYLQNLWEMYYNVGVDGLSEFERWILVMTSESKKEAERLAKGDAVMEEYIKEAKEAIKRDKSLRCAYDHEAELVQVAHENGYDKGLEEGKIDVAKEMKKQGFSLETISSIIKIPIDKLSSWLL